MGLRERSKTSSPVRDREIRRWTELKSDTPDWLQKAMTTSKSFLIDTQTPLVIATMHEIERYKGFLKDYQLEVEEIVPMRRSYIVIAGSTFETVSGGGGFIANVSIGTADNPAGTFIQLMISRTGKISTRNYTANSRITLVSENGQLSITYR